MHGFYKRERLSGLVRLVPFVLALAAPVLSPAQTALERVELDRLVDTGIEAYANGEYRSALSALESAYALTSNAWPEDDLDALAIMSSLGFLYQAMGRFGEAEPLYLRALEGRKRVLGEEHPDTLLSVNDLALLYYETSRYLEAEPLQLRALVGFERVLGRDHRYTLTSVSNLAGLYESMVGRYADAVTCH